MTDDKHDHDHDDGGGSGGPIAPASGRARTSLASLTTAFNQVNLTAFRSYSGKPLLLFRSREDGSWTHGSARTLVEEGSRWACNPASMKWGHVAFPDESKRPQERLVPITQPLPDPLPERALMAWTRRF